MSEKECSGTLSTWEIAVAFWTNISLISSLVFLSRIKWMFVYVSFVSSSDVRKHKVVDLSRRNFYLLSREDSFQLVKVLKTMTEKFK